MAGDTRGTVTRLTSEKAKMQARKQKTVRTENIPLNLCLSIVPSIINNSITDLLWILPNKVFTELRAVILTFSSVLFEVSNTTWKTWK